MKPLRTVQRGGGTGGGRVLLLAIFLPCGLVAAVAGDTTTPASTCREVQILATTDLHGTLRDGSVRGRGGWLRLATLLDERRRLAGPERTLVVDCGDTIQGSFEALVSAGEAPAAMVKATGVDVWVPGNHDFDFGVRRLQWAGQVLADQATCGNLELPPPVPGLPGTRFPAWRLFQRNGVRVAVIGATASYLSQWLWGRDLDGYAVERAVPMLERILPEVRRAHPDVIVLAIHQGWTPNDTRGINEVPAVARRFPEISLVLGGHTHQLYPGRKIGPRTWYVQAGFAGDWLAAVTVTADPETHTVVDIRSELLPVTGDLAPEPRALAAVRPWLDAADRQAAETVGTLAAPCPPDGIPGENCAVSELFCRALAAATGADVVLHGKLVECGLPEGIITAGRLFDMIPYENSIAVAEIRAGDLAVILKEQAAWRGTTSCNGLWGMEAAVDKEGNLVELRAADGVPVPPDRKLRLACNSYTAAGGGGRYPELRRLLHADAARLTDTGIGSRAAVRAWLEQNRGIAVRPRAWTHRTTGAPASPAP